MLYSNKDLKRLIIPLMIEQLLAIGVGLIDTIMIAAAGEAAVSGVSLVDTVNILIINAFMALATGGAVVAGHFLGEKKPERACRAAWQLILFCLYSSVTVMVFFLAAHNAILRGLFGGADEAVMGNAKTYLIITAFSIVPLALYNAGAALFRAMGNSRITMWISLVMNLINLCGNAILIFGLHMGVAGAALATTFSRMVAAVIILVLLKNPQIEINICGQAGWRLKKELISKILYIGIPNSLENSMFQLGKILLLSLVSTLGTYAIAANAVANTITNLNILPGMAVNQALLAVVALCVGANQFDQAKYYTKKLIKIIYVCTWAISLLIFVGVDLVLAIYQLSPQTAELARTVVLYHAVMVALIWQPAFSLPNTLRASGEVIFPMVVSIVSMWVFRIGAAYVLCQRFDMGLLGVWVAMTIDWAFRGTLFVWRYLSGKWIHKMQKA